MKKVFFLLCAFAAIQSLSAQGTKAGPIVPDVAAYSISFEKLEEYESKSAGSKDVYVKVKITGILKNIGNKTYFPIEGKTMWSLRVEENGDSVFFGNPYVHGSLPQMAPGEIQTFNLWFTYIKNRPKPVVYLKFKHDPAEFDQGKYGTNDVLKKAAPF